MPGGVFMCHLFGTWVVDCQNVRAKREDKTNKQNNSTSHAILYNIWHYN